MAKHKLNKSKKGPYFLLVGPYDEGLRRAIKTLPAHARSFDDGLRAWKIADGYQDQAQAMIDEHSPSEGT